MTIRSHAFRLVRPKYGRTSASLCHPPRINWNEDHDCREETHRTTSLGVMLNVLASSPHAPQPCHHCYAPRPHWRPTRTTSTQFPHNQFTHSRRHLARRPTQFLNPLGTTTLTSQPPIQSPPSTAHTLHHQHLIGQPYNLTRTHPDRPIQPSRPNTPSNYR